MVAHESSSATRLRYSIDVSTRKLVDSAMGCWDWLALEWEGLKYYKSVFARLSEDIFLPDVPRYCGGRSLRVVDEPEEDVRISC